VWTSLSTHWPRKRDRNFTPEDALRYVNELERAKNNAKEAYHRAPLPELLEYLDKRSTPLQNNTNRDGE
jgi:hypothetical protein